MLECDVLDTVISYESNLRNFERIFMDVQFIPCGHNEQWDLMFCVIAGNISPIDVITHVPILCEESDIPYVYVASKEDLANAGATKRPTCCVLVLTKPAKGELTPEDQEKLKGDYDQAVAEVRELTSSMF
nr:H/ACA ribonucleoprotein complex subunit 2-like protein [Ipomoea batatas]